MTPTHGDRAGIWYMGYDGIWDMGYGIWDMGYIGERGDILSPPHLRLPASSTTPTNACSSTWTGSSEGGSRWPSLSWAVALSITASTSSVLRLWTPSGAAGPCGVLEGVLVVADADGGEDTKPDSTRNFLQGAVNGEPHDMSQCQRQQSEPEHLYSRSECIFVQGGARK